MSRIFLYLSISIGASLLLLLVSYSVVRVSGDLNGDLEMIPDDAFYDIRIMPGVVSLDLVEFSPKIICYSKSELSLRFRVKNNSKYSISSTTSLEMNQAPVSAAIRILNSNNEVIFEGDHVQFPYPILPYKIGPELSTTFHCPEAKGSYKIVADVVQEGIAWGYSINPKESVWIELLAL